MNIDQAIKIVSNKFIYKADKIRLFDSWRVMKLKDGVFKGDCDDYIMTVFWYLSGENLWKFLFNLLITHKYKVYNVITIDNETHIVGSYKDYWFDNFTNLELNKKDFFNKTGHKYRFQIYSPIIIIYLIIGLFK